MHTAYDKSNTNIPLHTGRGKTPQPPINPNSAVAR
jgi:hypothetical protein